ncbi:MAG TPA: DUF4333 domain-containing protein [Acidimicrobiales bacterium]|nr:DUF4333 domain-containing protein [Acidimicrobiales bacterium]
MSALAAFGCLLVLLSACGVSVGPHSTLSAPSLAHEISSQLAKDYQMDEAPTVTCPAGVQASKGTTFVCTTVIDDQPLGLDGTVTGSNGEYRVVPRDAVIHIPVLEEYLTNSIDQKTGVRPKTVECGDREFAVVAVLGTITCSATFPGSPRAQKVITTVVGKDGSVEYDLLS